MAYWACNWSKISTTVKIFVGGYGTMEEMLEVITWAQLGIHNKPVKIYACFFKDFGWAEIHDFVIFFSLVQVGLLNVDGYYDCLLHLFDNGVKEGFIKPSARNIVVSAPNAEELLMKMEVVSELVCLFDTTRASHKHSADAPDDHQSY